MGTFVKYIKSHKPYEEKLAELFKRLDVDSVKKNAIESFLAPLRDKGPVYRFHFDHTLRVTFLCVEVAKFMHLSEKTMLYAGLLHDIGKVQVPVETLGKTSGWTEKDTQNIRPHVMDGYRMIRGMFDFSAEIILRHHRFQSKGYPKTVPKCLHEYSLGTKMMIELYGRMLSLCDQFDAFHRINDHGGKVVVPTGESVKALMLKTNPDQKDFIEQLYEVGIFTTFTEVTK